jgi:hypothetical protein
MVGPHDVVKISFATDFRNPPSTRQRTGGTSHEKTNSTVFLAEPEKNPPSRSRVCEISFFFITTSIFNFGRLPNVGESR